MRSGRWRGVPTEDVEMTGEAPDVNAGDGRSGREAERRMVRVLLCGILASTSLSPDPMTAWRLVGCTRLHFRIDTTPRRFHGTVIRGVMFVFMHVGSGLLIIVALCLRQPRSRASRLIGTQSPSSSSSSAVLRASISTMLQGLLDKSVWTFPSQTASITPTMRHPRRNYSSSAFRFSPLCCAAPSAGA